MVRLNNRIAVAVITLALASTAHAQLVTPVTQIVNGSFEVPSLGMSKYAYPNATTGSWTYSAGAALVDAQGSSDFYGATAPGRCTREAVRGAAEDEFDRASLPCLCVTVGRGDLALGRTADVARRACGWQPDLHAEGDQHGDERGCRPRSVRRCS